jgi:hypothetical protein
MTNQTSVIPNMAAAVVVAAIGCLWLLSTPANGFTFRATTSHQQHLSHLAATDLSNFYEDNSDGTNGSDLLRSSMTIDSGFGRRSMIRSVLSSAAMVATTMVFHPPNAGAKIDVSRLPVEGASPPKLSSPPPAAPRSGQPVIELAGVQYTPAAMMLQLAEQTASMEGMMRASAADVQTQKSRKERVEAGSQGTGPGVVMRGDLTQSVSILTKNSQIAKICPKAAFTLQTIPEYLGQKSPTTDMTFDEYLTVAKKYEAAREDLRVAFEALPEDDQQEGRQIVRAIRRRDLERMAAMQQ